MNFLFFQTSSPTFNFWLTIVVERVSLLTRQVACCFLKVPYQENGFIQLHLSIFFFPRIYDKIRVIVFATYLLHFLRWYRNKSVS